MNCFLFSEGLFYSPRKDALLSYAHTHTHKSRCAIYISRKYVGNFNYCVFFFSFKVINNMSRNVTRFDN